MPGRCPADSSVSPPARRAGRGRRVLALLPVLLAACGGGGATAPGAGGSVSVSPAVVTLAPGEAMSFQAAIGGAATAVTWSVKESSGCGEVGPSGVYLAPPAAATCHVVASSLADPSRSAVAVVDVVAGGAPWRPFRADSPWNTLIAANPDLEPDSAALISDFASSSPWGAHLDVNLAGYSIPLYWTDSSKPAVTITARLGGEGWSGVDGNNATAAVPIPPGAAPDPQADHHLLLVDRQQGTEWGCWNVTIASGRWSAGVCATSDLAGSGVRPSILTAQPWYLALGARACGFPLVAGLIRADEIEAGRIDHALVVAYPHLRAGWFTPPASTGQARMGTDAVSTRGIPCGGRIQFDPSVDLSTLALTRSGRIIVRALQEYGAYVGDYSGSLSLYAENAASAQAYWGAGVLGSYELQGRIDLARFRVIKLGALSDNGNGN